MNTLPKPQGKYTVGITSFDVDDFNCMDHNGNHSTKRRIGVKVFYPAVAPNNYCSMYLTEEEGNNLSKTFKCKSFETDNIATHCYRNAEPINEKFPIVFFHHGFSGYASQNTVLYQDLVSQGYVIISVAHPTEAAIVTYTDGKKEYFDKKCTSKMMNPAFLGYLKEIRLLNSKKDYETILQQFNMLQHNHCQFLMNIIPIWTRDCISVLNYMENYPEPYYDFSKIASMGHSFGGSVSLALLKDPRFLCAVNIDGAVFGEHCGEDFKKPTLTICCKENINLELGGFLHNSAPSYIASFNNMKHAGFMDIKFFPGSVGMLGKHSPDKFKFVLYDLCNRFLSSNLNPYNHETTEFPAYNGVEVKSL